VRPFLRRISTDTIIAMSSDHAWALIPFTDISALKALTGYTFLSRMPHIYDVELFEAALTAATSDASVRGAFRSGAFLAFTSQFGISGGAIKNSYVEDGIDKKHIVAVNTTSASLDLIDSETGNTIAISGDIVGGGTGTGPAAYDVSLDGKAIICDFGMAASDPDVAPGRFRIDVDFSASPQAVATHIIDSTPYGEVQTDINLFPPAQGLVETHAPQPWGEGSYPETTVSAVYPITRGIDQSGSAVAITLTANNTQSGSNALSPSPWEEWSSDPADYPMTVSNSKETASHIGRSVVLTLPDATTKAFTIVDQTYSSAGAKQVTSEDNSLLHLTQDSVSGSQSLIATQGKLKIIYADPGIPVAIYEYWWNDQEITGTASDTSTDFWFVQTSVDVTSQNHLEVGILIDGQIRVLFTEDGQVTNEAWPGNIDFTTSSVFDTPTVSDATVIPTDYIKPLKRVHTAAPPFVSGHDGNIYSVDVKSATDWLVSMTRSQDVDGNSIASSFDIYASRLDEADLKDRFLAFMEAAVASADPTAAADLAAGTLDDYEIRLSTATSELCDATHI